MAWGTAHARGPRSWRVALVMTVTVLATSVADVREARATTVTGSGYLETADGEKLHYSYVHPAPEEESQGFPTLVRYSGYTNRVGGGADAILVDRGYAIISFTVRGSGCSSGTWEFFSGEQIDDGIRLLRFVRDQVWSDDDAIALFGESYGAIMALLVAEEAGRRRADGEDIPLTAVVAAHPMGDLYRDVLYPGGVPNSAVPAFFTVAQNGVTTHYAAETMHEECAQHIAARGASAGNQAAVFAAAHPWDDGDHHRVRSPIERIGDLDVPLFTVIAWQDDMLGSRPIELLEHLDVPYRAVVGSGHHQLFWGAFGEAIEFLDLHLKGQGEPPSSPITVWWESRWDNQDDLVAWAERGRSPRLRLPEPSWETALGAWPPPQAKTLTFALSAEGRLVDGPGEGPPDAYVAGGSGQSQATEAPVTGFFGPPPAGDDTWWVEPAPGRAVTYTTEPFERDRSVLGSASLDLWLSSTSVDTDLQATITEVRTNGEEVFVQHGWLRASHRALADARSTQTRPYHTHSFEDHAPLTPGVAEPIRLEILPFGHVFRAGSRLRVWIESPKVAADLYGFASLPAPVNLIHHDADHPSQLVLSVLPGHPAQADPPTCAEPAIRMPCR